MLGEWKLVQPMIDFGASLGMAQIKVEDEFARAIDYCLAKGKKYKDYNAFFRNWLKRTAEREGFKPSTPAPAVPKQPYVVPRSSLADWKPVYN